MGISFLIVFPSNTNLAMANPSPVFASQFLFRFNQKNTSSRHFQASNFPTFQLSNFSASTCYDPTQREKTSEALQGTHGSSLERLSQGTLGDG
jgi:hypothetical protein